MDREHTLSEALDFFHEVFQGSIVSLYKIDKNNFSPLTAPETFRLVLGKTMTKSLELYNLLEISGKDLVDQKFGDYDTDKTYTLSPLLMSVCTDQKFIFLLKYEFEDVDELLGY